MGVAAIEACYLIPVEPSSKGLSPSELLTLAFNHATRNSISTLKVFVLMRGSRFSEAVEQLRDGVSSNIRLGIRMFICRNHGELAKLVRKEGCSVLYVPGEYAEHGEELLKLLKGVTVEPFT